MKILQLIVMSSLFIMLPSCMEEETSKQASTPFKTDKVSSSFLELMSSSQTGVNFINRVKDSRKHNIIGYEYTYHGGGVCIGDVNGDQLPDLFFSANIEADRLYINKGDLKFEEATNEAGFLPKESWHFGATMADVNGDGHLDIYVCRSGLYEENLRSNLLYINDGKGHFTEEAKTYGLDDTGYSHHASFFDADNDGDLDAFIANVPFHKRTQELREQQAPNRELSDKLYIQENGKFTPYVTERGLLVEKHYALSVTVWDFNNDGWQDIYVANDYDGADFHYVNQKDGTFKNELSSAMKHISNNTMGSGAGDINNDGQADLVCVDMLSDDYERSKRMMGTMNVKKFWKVVEQGEHYQYMRNSLQLNQGDGHFSEIAQLSGIDKTDWSWAPLIADFNNDGWQDIYITNGVLRDYTDNDFFIYTQQMAKAGKGASLNDVLKMFESTPISNHTYLNNGDLSFNNVSNTFNSPSTFSNGAAYGDLDLDGDLEIVTNNINSEALIYKNRSVELGNGGYIQFKVKGTDKNPFGIGTKVCIECENDAQKCQNIQPVTGYLSSSEALLHFGIGEQQSCSNAHIYWPNGEYSVMDITANNQKILIEYEKQAILNPPSKSSVSPLLKEVTPSILGITYRHQENDFDDYEKNILLPHKMSQFGPYSAVGDINNDGLEDIWIGGAKGQAAELYLQVSGGRFQKKNIADFSKDKAYEDMEGIFFDSDNDNDLDLYVVSGGAEQNDAGGYLDRLYINDGNGNFSYKKEKLPISVHSSGLSVSTLDFNQDGWQDLLVGGRHLPNNYPYHPQSYLLQNNNGVFEDVTELLIPDLQNLGMITDMICVDHDQDGDEDIWIVGEWMPVTYFINNEGAFTKNELNDLIGWWNCIKLIDYKQDGTIDFALGNLGLNSKFKASKEKPLAIRAQDFDQNGTHDIVLSTYNDNMEVPIRGRECLSWQLPTITQQYPTYKAFSKADINQILNQPNVLGEAKKTANELRSGLLVQENGEFHFQTFANQGQISTMNDLVSLDINGDKKTELIAVGNFYGPEVETGRNDASIGWVMDGIDPLNEFMNIEKSGFVASKDARSINEIRIQNTDYILITNNNAKPQLFKLNRNK